MEPSRNRGAKEAAATGAKPAEDHPNPAVRGNESKGELQGGEGRRSRIRTGNVAWACGAIVKPPVRARPRPAGLSSLAATNMGSWQFCGCLPQKQHQLKAQESLLRRPFIRVKLCSVPAHPRCEYIPIHR